MPELGAGRGEGMGVHNLSIPPPPKLLFQSKEGLQRVSQNSWEHYDPEKGTEGAQVYSFLGKELRQEHRTYLLGGTLVSRTQLAWHLYSWNNINARAQGRALAWAWSKSASSWAAEAYLLLP